MSTLLRHIDEALEAALEDLTLPPNLREAVRYALLEGGKRLRPTLVLRSCQAIGGSAEDALPAAVALEMTHAFSLIHDDLPAMDDDDLRRGRPTVHKQFGEAMAILAGDLLATAPYLVLARSKAPAKTRSRLIRELSHATTRMIVGQTYDLLGGFDNDLDEQARLETLHRHKTGAIIRAACRMGAIAGSGGDREIEALTRYGEALGLMFQIVDDLLDVTQTAETLGKASGKDDAAGKRTYPGLIGVDASKARVRELAELACAAVEQFDAENRLAELARAMAVRTK
ncbi:MAG: polyprenyl synthetase family protein [Phycisphaerales bacterium]